MRRFLFLTLLALAGSTGLLFAQAPNIASYDLLVFAPGVDPSAGSPISDTPFPASAVTCNQTALTPGTTVVNPTLVEFDDAANAGKVCTINLAGGTVITSLPIASGYVVVLTQTDGNGLTSARSAASNPFGVAASPATITGVKVIRK